MKELSIQSFTFWVAVLGQEFPGLVQNLLAHNNPKNPISDQMRSNTSSRIVNDPRLYPVALQDRSSKIGIELGTELARSRHSR